MKQFRCGDVIPGCDELMQGSVDEIVAQARIHVRRAHGIKELTPEIVAAIDVHSIELSQSAR